VLVRVLQRHEAYKSVHVYTYIYIHPYMYSLLQALALKELAQSYGLPAASWRIRKANGVTHSQTTGLRIDA
jgi:hypothetical protein